ncbi:MAG TPA: GMC family oxidoreductase N-terminal domain-containing protein [Thermoleophilaceae bacterium]|jgi:choline dehydrogenase-like flavoprotein
MPGAEGGGGVPVVDPALRLLACAPPRMRTIARLALAVVEWSPFPRRFSRLALDDRARRIERLEGSGSLSRRSVALLAKTLSCVPYASDERVRAAVGWDPRCEMAPGAEPPRPAPPLDPAALAPPPAGEVVRCDVVVVGSGAGGAAAARVLAEAGLDVVVLEEGGLRDAGDRGADPIAALTSLYRDGGLTACDGKPPIPLPVGRCVGGTTVINSGTSVRPPPGVLERWRDEHGIGWAAELESELEGVERDLAVTPVDPASAGRNAELCRAGAEAVGASNGPLPRMAGRVACCGTCPMGCAIDAKQAMHVSELPRAAAAGARIWAGARVEKVVLEGGRAAGVVARRTGGAGGGGGPTRGRSAPGAGRFVVAARAVVLAGGALGTPELLLAQGRGNGHVGRHLRIQPACWVGARFPGEAVRGWDGVMQSWGVDQWLDRRLFLEATFSPLPFGAHWMPGAGARFAERVERYGEMAVLGVHLADRSEGRVGLGGGRLRLTYRLTAEDAAALRFGIAQAARIHFAAGAAEVYPQVAGLGVLRPGDEGRVEDGRLGPADLRLEAFHPMGTARMGPDPSTSVVSPSGEVHGVPDLYVADASVLPTSLGANPMLTIMAVARRIARGLAGR